MFALKFKIESASFKLDHKDEILLIGSCFSNEIYAKFKYSAFNVHANPMGTVFHPMPIARFIRESIKGIESERIFKRGDLFFSWDAGSLLYSLSEESLYTDLSNVRKIWSEKLKTSNYLFITFGTAWAYNRIDEKDLVVANCHKIPSDRFEKKLTESESIVDDWNSTIELIQSFNPQLNIIFTVSPVRHIKDGLINNNRSKAELIKAVSTLVENKNCFYFPSYEIVIDELRDYRFFKEDFVHPNELAVNYVWDKLKEYCFSIETIELCKEIDSIRNSEKHKVLHPESSDAAHFEKSIQRRKELLFAKYPELIWK